MSSTVTTKVAVLALPRVSSAVHSTVVSPKPNVAPVDGGAGGRTRTPSTASVASTSKETAAPADEVASTVRSAGTSMTGPVVSCTCTVRVPVESLPAASWTVQVTAVSPSGNWLPEAGTQVGVRSPSWTSVAVAAS